MTKRNRMLGDKIVLLLFSCSLVVWCLYFIYTMSQINELTAVQKWGSVIPLPIALYALKISIFDFKVPKKENQARAWFFLGIR